MSKIKLTINDKEVEVPAGATVMQACQAAAVEVPHFCYHERLDIAGNCRMCLVEMENAPKPIASCAMPAADGMVIHTDTEEVEKARNGVMEFLLLNHPLDCPICDQAGECDLQDQAMAYGFDKSRTKEMRRAVKEKYMGPLIKTYMTRCIHCTRCVRFIEDIAGIEELGAIHRGEHMEISTYVEKSLSSELSGNIIDLCPVGALTSKPYQFKARAWELKKTESIDVMDAVGSNIRVDARGNEVLRIMPRLHEDVNEEWISDKTRFACDGLKYQRLDKPYVRKEGKLQPATWEEAFAAIKRKFSKLKGKEIAALAGNLCDVESMFALKSLMKKMRVPNTDCRIDGALFDTTNRGSYIFNTSIAGIEQADACLIVGSNPRVEAPLIQARLRKRYRKGGFTVGLIGPQAPLTHAYYHVGEDPTALEQLVKGRGDFAKVLKKAKNPMIILGAHALTRRDGQAVLDLAWQVAQKFDMIRRDWNGFNILHHAAARVGGLDVGFVPEKGGLSAPDILNAAESGAIKAVYLLGADKVDTTNLKNTFVIYQGHHGDAGAHVADVILPGAAYTEKSGTYVNTEGRVQIGQRAIFPPGDAKEDWKIIRALSDVLDKTLPFNSLEDLRAELRKTNPVFKTHDEIVPAKMRKPGRKGAVDATIFDYPIANFYMTNVIAAHSKTMAQCSRTLVEPSPDIKREAA